MKAAYLEDHFQMKIVDIPVPEPRPNEVLTRVHWVGVCGSEVHAYNGTHPFRDPPAVLGHEFAGEVVEVGAEVTDFKVGDRVTAVPHQFCGQCPRCRAGLTNICDNMKVMGTPGWTGAFGEYVATPAHMTLPLPDHMSDEQGVMVEPLAVGLRLARSSGLRLGDTALVCGAGTIGLVTALAYRAAGAADVILTDAIDYNLGVAAGLGFEHTVNVRREKVLDKVMDWTGGAGVDHAAVCVGLSVAFQDALQAVHKAGTVMVVALFEEPLSFTAAQLVNREMVIRGSQIYTVAEVRKALDLIAAGQVDPLPLITHRMPIEDCKKALDLMIERTEDVVKILLHF